MKNKPLRFSALVSFLILVTLLMVFPWQTVQGQSSESATLITGRVIDRQNQLVADAVVTLVTADNDNPLSQTITQADGRYALSLPETLPDHLIVRIEREHFHLMRPRWTMRRSKFARWPDPRFAQHNFVAASYNVILDCSPGLHRHVGVDCPGQAA